MTKQLTADDWEAHRGTTVSVRESSHELTLVSVDRMKAASPALREPFVLVFSGPAGRVLREGLHTLDLPDGGGAFEIYVMPIHTASRERQDYQALFN